MVLTHGTLCGMLDPNIARNNIITNNLFYRTFNDKMRLDLNFDCTDKFIDKIYEKFSLKMIQFLNKNE